MHRFSTLLWANLKMAVRNRQALFWSLACPLVLMLLMGFVFGGGLGGSAKVGVADRDGTQASEGLVKGLLQSDRVVVDQGQAQSLLDKLRNGDLEAVVIIPSGFQKAIGAAVASGTASGGGTGVDVYYDPGSLIGSQVAAGTVTAVVENFQKAITKAPQLIKTSLHNIQQESISYTSFLIPGILALALLTSGVIGISTTVVVYREQGILRRVQVTPLPVSHFMGGRVLTQVVISILQAVVLLGIGKLAFDITILGSFGLVLLLLVAGTLAFVFLGFFISSFTKNAEAAGAVANVVNIPMMFLGGIFFPVSNIPNWIKPVVRIMPVKYLADGLRDVMVRGRGIERIWVDLVVLAGTALFFALLSVRVFRWQE